MEKKKKTKLIGIVLFISLLKFCGWTRSYKGKGKERKGSRESILQESSIGPNTHLLVRQFLFFFFFLGLFVGMPGQELYT